MNYSLLINDIEGDMNRIFVEECLLIDKRKRQVDEATKWELKMQEESSPNIRSELLVEC